MPYMDDNESKSKFNAVFYEYVLFLYHLLLLSFYLLILASTYFLFLLFQLPLLQKFLSFCNNFTTFTYHSSRFPLPPSSYHYLPPHLLLFSHPSLSAFLSLCLYLCHKLNSSLGKRSNSYLFAF